MTLKVDTIRNAANIDSSPASFQYTEALYCSDRIRRQAAGSLRVRRPSISSLISNGSPSTNRNSRYSNRKAPPPFCAASTGKARKSLRLMVAPAATTTKAVCEDQAKPLLLIVIPSSGVAYYSRQRANG